jgi:hypothetical protein
MYRRQSRAERLSRAHDNDKQGRRDTRDASSRCAMGVLKGRSTLLSAVGAVLEDSKIDCSRGDWPPLQLSGRVASRYDNLRAQDCVVRPLAIPASTRSFSITVTVSSKRLLVRRCYLSADDGASESVRLMSVPLLVFWTLSICEPTLASSYFANDRIISKATDHGNHPFGRANIGVHEAEEPRNETLRDWPNIPGTHEAAGGTWRNGAWRSDLSPDWRHSQEREVTASMWANRNS